MNTNMKAAKRFQNIKGEKVNSLDEKKSERKKTRGVVPCRVTASAVWSATAMRLVGPPASDTEGPSFS